MEYIISIDIGGTNIRSAVVDFIGNIIIYNTRLSTKNIIEDIIECVEIIENNWSELKNKEFLNKIGISIGGCVNKEEGKIVYVDKHIGLWNEINIKYELINRLKKKYMIKIDNDGNCAAFAEHKFGNALYCNNFIVIVLGTGIGIGCMINGKMIQYSEIGYLIEDKCSGKYFDKMNNKLKNNKNKTELINNIYTIGANTLADKIVELIILLNPEKIILNGPLLNIGNDFKNTIINRVNEQLKKKLFLKYKIIISSLNNQGILGASSLF